MTAPKRQKSKAPYLFYRGYIEVKELNPAGQYFRVGPKLFALLTRT